MQYLGHTFFYCLDFARGRRGDLAAVEAAHPAQLAGLTWTLPCQVGNWGFGRLRFGRRVSTVGCSTGNQLSAPQAPASGTVMEGPDLSLRASTYLCMLACMHNKTVSAIAAEGGKARAAALSSDQRREIARFAAQQRWAAHETVLPKETHTGTLEIGDIQIPCAVLDNGIRVFSTRGVTRAVGGGKTGTGGGVDGAPRLPPFLGTSGVKSFIRPELMARLISPVQYKPKHGGRSAFGYEATLLPTICEVLIDADRAGYLKSNQKHLARRADTLLRGFARVGIIALVDEATGYQAERARDELNKILEAYISKELLPWTQRFPDEFFRQIYRLHNWEFKAGTLRGPRYVGKLINKLIYKPLPPGVLEELKRLNPPNEKGYRRYKHHQFLTEEIGEPHLEKQVIEVTALMRVSDDKNTFEKLFQKAFPSKDGFQLELLPDPESET
ncbi:MAG: hypothetical protein DMF84_11580 [Acidobacteria bacterium]|nr:MAG: hypothetical protein DMF84_11580 [Acidobacteriota bacterium]